MQGYGLVYSEEQHLSGKSYLNLPNTACQWRRGAGHDQSHTWFSEILPKPLIPLYQLQLQSETVAWLLLPHALFSSGFPYVVFRKLIHNLLCQNHSSLGNKSVKPTAAIHIGQNQNWLLGFQDELLVNIFPQLVCLALGCMVSSLLITHMLNRACNQKVLFFCLKNVMWFL